MRFDLFEVVDIFYHRMMLRSHKWYRNAVKKLCNASYTISAFDQWRLNRLYQLHVIFKRLYIGHMRKPKCEHTLFLLAMDEVFTYTKVLKVLFNNIRIRVVVGATTDG